MNHVLRQHARQRGTVYLVALSTAMIVAVMGVSGLLAVRVQHRSTQLNADLIAARSHARSAAELARWHLLNDADWTTLSEAQRTREQGQGSFTFSYRAAEAGGTLAADGCEAVWVDATGRQGEARTLLSIKMEPQALKPQSHGRALMTLLPAGYWPLTEAGGTAAGDDAGQQQGLYHSVELQRHDTRHCLRTAGFDGVSSVVEIPHHDLFATDGGAIVFWFKSDDIARGQGLFSKDASGLGNGGHLTIRLSSGSVVARLSSHAQTYEVGSSTLASDRWHHVAFTFGAGGMQLYVDGEQVGSHSYTGGTGWTVDGAGNAEPIAIGADASGSAAGSISGFIEPLLGQMFDVAIFNRPLSASDVQQLHDAAGLQRRYRPVSMTWRDRVD
ncbi:MAG: LamG domain-containing protein [Phycisphaeraceae bacterium]